MTEIHLLQNIYLFKDLSTTQLEEISKITSFEELEADKILFDQDDAAEALFIIKYGSVRIFQKNKQDEFFEVAMLSRGSHFGEMAFVDGKNRSAAAMCVEKTEVLKIEFKDLFNLLQSNHDISSILYKSMAVFLAGRLRATTLDLNFSREENISFF